MLLLLLLLCCVTGPGACIRVGFDTGARADAISSKDLPTPADAAGDRSGPGDLPALPTAKIAVTNDTLPSTNVRASWTGDAFILTWEQGPGIGFAKLSAAGELVAYKDNLSDRGTSNAWPTVLPAADGYLLVWEDGSSGEIVGRALDTSGAAKGPSFTIVSSSAAQQPFVVATASGFAMTWQDLRVSSRDIYLALLDAKGTLATTPQQVSSSTATSDDQWMTSSAAGFGIVWHDLEPREVHFARADAQAKVLGQAKITPTGVHGKNPAICSSDGEYLAVWADDRDGEFRAYVARYGLDGALRATPTNLTPAEEAGGVTIGCAARDVLVVVKAMTPTNIERLDALFVDRASLSVIERRSGISEEATVARLPWTVWSGSVFGVAWQARTTGEPEIWLRLILPAN